MSVQNIELVRGEANTIHWLIPEPNMVEIRLLLLTDEAIVIMPQERFVEEGGGTGVYAIFSVGEIEDIDAQNAGLTNYILKDTQYDEILFTGSVTLTGVGGGTPAEVEFEDLVPMKTTSPIVDVPITAAVDMIRASDGKYYKKNLAGDAYEDFSQDISAEDITHTALLAKIAASTLIPGTYYKITDFASVHTIPGTTDTNTPTAEPLIVLAIAVNKLSPVAYSPSFPQDIIYYEATNDQAMVPGCTKGYIYRRIDTVKSIDIGFDWRSVKFRRWKLDAPLWDSGTAYVKGNVVKGSGYPALYVALQNNTNVALSTESTWLNIGWINGDYAAVTATNWVINSAASFPLSLPTSADYLDYNIFATASNFDAIYNIKIAQNGSNILVSCNSIFRGNYINNLVIGAGYANNSSGTSFERITIGRNCSGNSFSSGMSECTIGHTFTNNAVGACSNSTFGNYVTSNVLGTSSAAIKGNRVGNYFVENAFGGGLLYNTIGDYFQKYLAKNSFQYNNIGSGFDTANLLSATLVYGAYPKFWIKSPDGTKKLYYHADTTFAATFADLTA